MIQTRWTYLNADYSLLTEVERILLDGHFVVEHGARSRRGNFFNFNGTGGVWRRCAIEDAGGWQHDTLTEDTDLSYRAQLRGWRFIYLPDVGCASELPVEMTSFKSQQARWAKGLMQTAKKILPRVLRSNEPLHIKAEAFFHLTGNISYPLMIVLSTMLLPAMIVRFYQGTFQMLVIDLPLFLASTCSISSFYLVAQRSLHPKTWKRAVIYMPFVMAVGIGLSVRNAIAVLEAHLWQGIGIHAHAETRHRRPAGHAEGPCGEEVLSQSLRMAALSRARAGRLLPGHRGLCLPKRKLRYDPVSIAVCLGLSVHRCDVAGTRLVRTPALRSCREARAIRGSRRRYRSAGLLAFRSLIFACYASSLQIGANDSDQVFRSLFRSFRISRHVIADMVFHQLRH